MTNQTVEINENLVKIDNLLKGLEFLYEEITTRKDELIKSMNLEDIVKGQMKENDFLNEMSYYIRNHYGDGICRNVSYIVMDNIDRDIDAFINNRVNQALERAGVEVKSQETSTSSSSTDW
jgi:hypothetical protein